MISIIMDIRKFFRNQNLLIIAGLFLSTSYLINRRNTTPYFFVSKQQSSVNFNDELLVHFNLGLKRFFSSVLWVSTILESDIDHYKNKDTNSWMFLRFNSISKLEPQFYENYAFGGPYLSIVKDDLEGASLIYKKGLSFYPNDFNLLKNASFHFYFEVKDLSSAYPLFKRMKLFPNISPNYLTTLSRLEANLGNLEEAYAMLSEMQMKHSQETLLGKKIYEFRYSLKAEIDLNCLDKKSTNCSLTDLDNNPYLRTLRGFKAIKNWIPYRPKWKN